MQQPGHNYLFPMDPNGSRYSRMDSGRVWFTLHRCSTGKDSMLWNSKRFCGTPYFSLCFRCAVGYDQQQNKTTYHAMPVHATHITPVMTSEKEHLQVCKSDRCYNNNLYLIVFAAMGLLLFLLGQGCASADGPVSTEATLEAIVPAPVKIVVMQDKSGSVTETRTQQLNEDHLRQLAEVVLARGGELAFGLIRGESNLSLLRMQLTEPPLAPELPTADGSRLVRIQKEKAHEEARSKYDAVYAIWRDEALHEIQAFMKAAKAQLERPASARKTDIHGAVLRADLFLAESDLVWSQPTHRYALFVSDGIDTSKKQPIDPVSGAQFILVNGAASIGSLEALAPERFESASAAINYIRTLELTQ